MKHLLAALAILLTQACAAEHSAAPVTVDQLEVKGATSDGGTIGIDKHDRVVVRHVSSVQDDLAVLELSDTYLEDQVRAREYDLNRCRTDMVDTRLGGSGEPIEYPSAAPQRPERQLQTETGLDEQGELTTVTREFLDQRVGAEKRYSVALKAALVQLKRDATSCEARLSKARLAHGLPGQRYQAPGYYAADGTFVSNDHGEASLDDGFETAARAKKKSQN